MATTPQGDDADVRATVMHGLARQVARQRMATGATKAKPKKLSATFTPMSGPRAMRP